MRYFFGNSAKAIDPSILKKSDQQAHHLSPLLDTLAGTGMVIAHQVHGTQGNIITNAHAPTPYDLFRLTGDFLITDQPHIALGILTADCVPLFLYDAHTQVIAAVHAGWRGTVANIVTHTIDAMKNVYKTQQQHIYAFIGPHARACCYSVGQEVIDAVDIHAYTAIGLIQKNAVYHLHMENILRAQLHASGIANTHINSADSSCTLCSDTYHSFRKTKTHLRQINYIVLTS